MAAIAVNVHFNVGNPGLQHGDEILVRPDGVAPVTGARASDESRGNVAGDWRSGIAGEWRRARINDAHKIGPRGNSSQQIARVAVLFIEVIKKYRCRRR